MKRFVLLVLLLCWVADDNVLAKRKTFKTHKVHKQNQVKQIHRGPISKDKSGNIVLQIKAKPGAKNNHITDINPNGIGVRIKAPPVDGKANVALIEYLSKVLGLRKNNIILDRGSKSRNKKLTIHKSSIGIDDVHEKINQEIQKGNTKKKKN